jgi:hypothetical protein
MKFAGKIVFAVAIVGSLMMSPGCKKHKPDPVPVTDQQIDLLSKGPWKVSTVTLDDVDKKADYTAFQLTMTGTKGTKTVNFNTSGRPSLSPWPANGNFTFDDTNPTTTMTRNDTPPVVVTYTATATNLSMNFQFSGNGYTARIGNVKGQWKFTFTQ